MNQTRLPLTDHTPVEGWLARLGLKVTEVAECPMADCAVCAPRRAGDSRAA